MTPEQMLLALGGVLRNMAGVEGPLDEYQRSQALSAFSVSRNYAAELASREELLAWLRDTLGPALDADGRPEAAAAREALDAATDGPAAGAALGDLLEALRSEAAAEDPLRRQVQQALAGLADRELAELGRRTG